MGHKIARDAVVWVVKQDFHWTPLVPLSVTAEPPHIGATGKILLCQRGMSLGERLLLAGVYQQRTLWN